MSKYDELSDNELLFLYRQNDTTAQKILVYRYKGFSYTLAKGIQRDFGYNSMLEIDDLVGIGLLSLHISASSFNEKLDMPLYPYWRKVAVNNMMEYVKDITTFKKNKESIFNPSTLKFLSEVGSLSSNQNDTILRDEIIAFLNNPKNGISKRNRDMFICYMDGESCSEIAARYQRSYYTIKNIIEDIKRRIKAALF